MKFFAIIFLATLSYIGDEDKTENLYSYQLQFESYQQCIHFYNNNTFLNRYVIVQQSYLPSDTTFFLNNSSSCPIVDGVEINNVSLFG